MRVDLDRHPVLDTDQLRELPAALVRIRILDHHGRLEIAAVRNERVVGCELLLDAFFFEDPLDAQHLLHLVTDGELVLEDKSHVLAEVNRAVLLVGNDLRPELRALARVGLKGHEACAVDSRHGIHRHPETGSDSVSLTKQRQRMRLDCTGLAHALLYVTGGDRAVGADVVGLAASHLPEDRPPDLHGVFEVLGFDAPGSIVAGATLYRVERRPRYELQRFAGLLSHVLHARMAWDVVGHFSERGLEVGLEQSVTLAQDEVLERVEHRLAYRLDFGIAGKQQRQLALEHQGARGHGGKNRVAFACELDESRNVMRFQSLYALEIA